MTQQEKNVVVKCDSLEEWNTVQKFCNKNYLYKFSKDGCIKLEEGTYWSISDKEAIQKEGYKVISFDDFKKEYLKEFMDNFDKPMKQKLTSLPEKYQVLCSDAKETSLVMCTLHYDYKNNHPNWSYWKYVAFDTTKPSGDNGNPNILNTKIDEFTEITFEQFKKWVLKEDNPKFEVGKWYKYTREDIKEPNYAKYSANQSVNDRFYYDEFISINGWKKGHNWSVLRVNPVLLTDLSEIQQYLPDGHEDKIMEPKKQSLKGRYLKALVDSPSAISSAKKGDYFRIDDESRKSCTLLKDDTSYLSCVSDLDFELIPEGFNPTQLNNKVIDLTNTKIWIGDNPELSKQVQEKAFELGWKGWNNKGVINTQCTSLYFDSRRYISYSDSKTSDYFNNHKNKEIKPQDLGISYPIIVGETAGNIPNSQFYAIRYDPFEMQTKPKIDENVLLKPIKKITLDTIVNKVTSINTELVKPKTIIYF